MCHLVQSKTAHSHRGKMDVQNVQAHSTGNCSFKTVHTIPGTLTGLSTWMSGFSAAQYTQLWQWAVPCSFITPNFGHKLIPVYSVLKPRTKLHPLIRTDLICSIQWLLNANFPSSTLWNAMYSWAPNSCPMCILFCDQANSSKTKAEEPGLTDVQGLSDLCLCTSCSVQSASNMSWMNVTVNCAGGSAANSSHRQLWTSRTFLNFKYHSKLFCTDWTTTALLRSLMPSPSIRWLWHSCH
jgi:hypothetical protein